LLSRLESSLKSQLESIYAVAKVCEPDGINCASLDPELTAIMKSSRDYDRILWAWKGWHDATGPKMRHTYTKIVEIQNKGAVFSNYKDLSENWIEDFQDKNFEVMIDGLFNEIKPLYEQIHAYARRKLAGLYGSKYPANHDPKLIPAHLLGNMWAQSWDNIYDLLVPFPDAKEANLTKVLIEKKYTPIKIFEVAFLFFIIYNFSYFI
jgi:peptidyl-dipeptidase A